MIRKSGYLTVCTLFAMTSLSVSAVEPETALDGNCPVCLVKMDKLVEGDPGISSVHDGKTYRFPSSSQKRVFDADPTAFAPVLGGNCAVCKIDMGKDVPGKPEFHSVRDGRLFLFPSQGQKRTFDRSPRRYTDALAPLAVSSASSMQSVERMSRAYLHSSNIPSSGVAIEGYCPVAYFAVNKAVRGKPEHASTYNSVTYHLVSADAKRAFDADPEKYIPAYGGWCAFGMAVNDKFPIDPTNFKIIDGRLMLFLKNQKVDAMELWNNGYERTNVAKASAHWAKVSG